MESQETWIVKEIMKNNKLAGALLSDFKTHYKATLIKTKQRKTCKPMKHNRGPRNKPLCIWSNDF